jgi:hypothetical protein
VDSISFGRAKTSLTPVVQSDLKFQTPSHNRPQTPRLANRPKPRPTPTQPVFETRDFSLEISADRQPTPKPKARGFPKWQIEPTDSVTQDDIDFFMFCTPYVMPPELLNEMLDES